MSTPRSAAGGLSRTPPTIGTHVLDGTRPPLYAVHIVLLPILVAGLLVLGGIALREGLVAVGLGLMFLVLSGAGMALGLVVASRRFGLTWREDEERSWPDESFAAEIVEVWEEQVDGFPRAHGFWLRVLASEGVWEVRTRQAVPEHWLSALRPGQPVKVRARPDDHHRVPIDWTASRPPG